MQRLITSITVCFIFILGCKKPSTKEIYIVTRIQSQTLAEDRDIYIQLPTDYYDQHSSETNYPVIVLLDGSTYLQITIEAVDSIITNLNYGFITPIIVAIDSPDREKDFTYSKIETVRQNNTGGGPKFLQFLESEVIPFINERFRTSDSRILIGHSLGGLCVLNVFLSENVTFQFHIASDPSIWWEQDMIEDKIVQSSKNFKDKKLFIATASRDTIDQPKNLDRHLQISDLISNVSYDEIRTVHQYYPDETHRSIPEVAIRDGLEMLLYDSSNH